MAEAIGIDTNILIDASRGNRAVADALNKFGMPAYTKRSGGARLIEAVPGVGLGAFLRGGHFDG